jgi:hypothetical protein
MQAQHNRALARQLHLLRIDVRQVRRFVGMFAVFAALTALLVVGIYMGPLTLVHDVGTRPETMSGMYPAEKNAHFSYAYTNGDATLQMPQLGHGQFMISLHMSGPGERVALPTHLVVNGQPVDLGPVEQLRTYRVLAPSDAAGAVTVRLRSQTATIGGDERRLGVLLDRIEARSLGETWPTGSLLASVLLLIGLVTAATCRRAWSFRRQFGVLLGMSMLLGLLCWAGRGNLDMLTWWCALLLFGLLAIFLHLSKAGARAFARPVTAIVALFLTWRAALWVFAALGLRYSMLFNPVIELVQHNDYDTGGSRVQQVLANSWVRWDSTLYLSIADRGYAFYGERWPNMAFFPLYPLLIRATALLTGVGSVIAAVLVAQVAFLAALLILYRLLAADFGDTIAFRSLLLLVVCPSAFFFGAAYSESVALLMLVAAVWALRRQRWWLAGLAGFLLALARLPGVLIAPMLALAYLQACNWNWRAVRWPIMAALLPPLGLGLFMLFQWWQFGTPFAFMIAQRSWHNYLSPPWVLPRALYDHTFVYGHWPMAAFQSIFWVAFLALTVGALRRMPLLYSVTLLLVLLPPYLSSWPWSVSRHVLLGFPAFVMLAWWTERVWLRQMLIVGMVVLQGLVTMLFVNGFLVA